MWHFISEKISETTQTDFICDDIRNVSGGDTHEAFRISDGRRRFFVKISDADANTNLHCEALGLMQLSKNQDIRIPKLICNGMTENKSYLVLEHINLKDGAKQDWEALGSGLAHMHQNNRANMFGCEFNNFIGITPQPNGFKARWADFFAENRIGHVLRLLANKGITFVNIDAAVENTKTRLKDHSPIASMLHGDLWHGNVGFFKHQGVIFDPAFYYGDRETDIAMTELFGRFPKAFYDGYNKEWPLEEGYKLRKTLYQLYHILNHALMFGGHYMQSAKQSLLKMNRL